MPTDLRERAAVDEGRVAEAREPVMEVVVDRVVDPAAVLTAEAEVQRRHAQVLEERV